MKLNYLLSFCFILSLILVAGAHDAPPGMAAGEIVVMEHDIEVRQEGGILIISESMLFNNTGDGVFEGKVITRIPGNARVESATGQFHVHGGEGAHVCWSLVLSPGESARMGLVYTVTPHVSGLIWKNSIFEKELQYPTGRLILVAITERDVVASTAGLTTMQESEYDETLGMNVALFVGANMPPQRVRLAMEWTEVSTAAQYAGVIALVMVLIALPILKIKSRGIKKEGREELEYRKKALLSTLNQIEDDHQAGEISEVEYQELKSEYEKNVIKIMKKLDKIREDTAEPETKRAASRSPDKVHMPDTKIKKLGAKENIKELKMKKDALISMLKQIEDDYKAGAITKGEYQELKSEYEDSAIKIMRRLDEMRRGEI